MRQAGPALTAAYHAGVGSDSETLDDKVTALVNKRVSDLLSNSAVRAPVNNNPFRAAPPAKPYSASARVADAGTVEEGAPEPSPFGPFIPERVGAHSALVYSVYVLLASRSRTRAPPKDGYPFPLSDKVSETEPPSACKVCGSLRHWDKECGHYHEYETRRKQGVLYVDSERHPDDAPLYNALYPAFANNTAFSSYLAEGSAVPLLPAMLLRSKPFVEDILDEQEFWLRGKPKAHTYLVEKISPSERATSTPSVRVEEVEDEEEVRFREAPKSTSSHILEDALGDGDEYRSDEFIPGLPDVQQAVLGQAMAAASIAAEAGPPPSETVFKVPAARSPPSGYSSVGISVLSCQGRVGSLADQAITLRMDSGASLTLVDEGYVQKLKNPPKIRTGLKVEIAQLTDKAPRIKGYVRVPVFIQDEDGQTLEFETEAYVVPGMTVDVLLGEDWHLNHEIGLIHFVRAYRVVNTKAASFVRAKSHRRAKANRHRCKLALRSGALRAFKDVVIPAATTCNVTIAGDLRGKRDWYVERNLVPIKGDAFLTVPNTFISTDTKPSTLPVTNPTSRPFVLKAGTLLAFAKDPAEYLDVPKTEDELRELQASAQVLAAMVQSLATRDADPAQDAATPGDPVV
ncbi:hypothetical protein EXIGLDRAFT_607371, partial [Exidia glandulosa HHB12029]